MAPSRQPARFAADSAPTTTTLILRPAERLDLSSALLMTAPLEQLTATGKPRAVVLDYGCPDANARPVSGLTEEALDRLACLPIGAVPSVGLATAVPSIARLTAVVASVVAPPQPSADPRSWFQDVLLAATLVATRSRHAVVEAAGAEDLQLARRLASQLGTLVPGGCPFPTPITSGFRPFLCLDGSGPMGTTARGTLYLSDSPEEVERKVRAAKTDGRSSFDPARGLSLEVGNLLLLLHALTGESVSAMIDRFTGNGYVRIKRELADAANAFLAPIRRRRNQLLSHEAALRTAVELESARLESNAQRLAEALTRTPEILAA